MGMWDRTKHRERIIYNRERYTIAMGAIVTIINYKNYRYCTVALRSNSLGLIDSEEERGVAAIQKSPSPAHPSQRKRFVIWLTGILEPVMHRFLAVTTGRANCMWVSLPSVYVFETQ